MSYKLMVFRCSVMMAGMGGKREQIVRECKEISKQLHNVHAMKLYFKNFEIYHNISIYSQLPPIHMILPKLTVITCYPKFLLFIIEDNSNLILLTIVQIECTVVQQ